MLCMFVSECVHVCVRVSALYMHFHMYAYVWKSTSEHLPYSPLYYFRFLSIFVSVYMCHMCVGVHRGQKSGRQELELQALCQLMWVIGAKVCHLVFLRWEPLTEHGASVGFFWGTGTKP